MTQNEWNTTEIRASKVGHVSPLSCPGSGLGAANHSAAPLLGRALPYDRGSTWRPPDGGAKRPDAVVVLIGANDRARDDDALRRVLDAAVAPYGVPRPKVVGVCGGSLAGGLDSCDATREAIAALARTGHPALFVRPDDELWARINRRPQFRSCDFHYSALGHQVLAENLAPLIRSWLAW